MYPYLPSIFSIYLLLISPVLGLYLSGLVDKLSSTTWSPPQKALIRNVARDWAARSGFLNAVLAALVSVFVTFQKYPEPAVVAALLFIVVAVPIGIWIVSHTTIGELVKKPTTILRWEIGMSPAAVCRVVLIVMNVVLLILVYVSQSWSAPN